MAALCRLPCRSQCRCRFRIAHIPQNPGRLFRRSVPQDREFFKRVGDIHIYDSFLFSDDGTSLLSLKVNYILSACNDFGSGSSSAHDPRRKSDLTSIIIVLH